MCDRNVCYFHAFYVTFDKNIEIVIILIAEKYQTCQVESGIFILFLLLFLFLAVCDENRRRKLHMKMGKEHESKKIWVKFYQTENPVIILYI